MTPLLIISALVLAILLLSLSFIDIKSYRLPNKFTFPLIASGLLHAYILGFPLKDHIIGAAIGYAVFFTVEHIFLKLRGYPGLGRGDAKLLAGGGAWTGWFGLPFIVLMASLAGLSLMFASMLTGRLKTQNVNKLAIPFGPFLSAAILLVWCMLILAPRL